MRSTNSVQASAFRHRTCMSVLASDHHDGEPPFNFSSRVVALQRIPNRLTAETILTSLVTQTMPGAATCIPQVDMQAYQSSAIDELTGKAVFGTLGAGSYSVPSRESNSSNSQQPQERAGRHVFRNSAPQYTLQGRDRRAQTRGR
jgi:hypothetical protein